MARKPKISRTIVTTHVDLLCINISEEATFTKTMVLPRTYKDDGAILKACEKLCTDDNIKIVHVVDKKIVSKKYYMTEQEFIEHGRIEE